MSSHIHMDSILKLVMREIRSTNQMLKGWMCRCVCTLIWGFGSKRNQMGNAQVYPGLKTHMWCYFRWYHLDFGKSAVKYCDCPVWALRVRPHTMGKRSLPLEKWLQSWGREAVLICWMTASHSSSQVGGTEKHCRWALATVSGKGHSQKEAIIKGQDQESGV